MQVLEVMPEEKWIQGVCDVCRILDNDVSMKEVQWCEFCKSNICRADQYSGRRLQAWAKKKGLNLRKFLNKFVPK